MSATSSSKAWPAAAAPAEPITGGPRFGRELGIDASGRLAVEWLLARNCSLAPRHCLAIFGSLALLALVIATLAWTQGATLVMPFAWLEGIALAVAFVAYTRHAGDRDRVLLADGRLTVERVDGLRTERIDFDPAWVRVERRFEAASLVELSGEGRRIGIGRFVRPEFRDALARELRLALMQRRPTE